MWGGIEGKGHLAGARGMRAMISWSALWGRILHNMGDVYHDRFKPGVMSIGMSSRVRGDRVGSVWEFIVYMVVPDLFGVRGGS